MELTAIQFLLWLAAMGVMWLTVLAIFEITRANSSDARKALWIAFILCTPGIGLLVFWLFGQGISSKEDLETREAALKARLNASSGRNE